VPGGYSATARWPLCWLLQPIGKEGTGYRCWNLFVWKRWWYPKWKRQLTLSILYPFFKNICILYCIFCLYIRCGFFFNTTEFGMHSIIAIDTFLLGYMSILWCNVANQIKKVSMDWKT
jgi:hypothetical protein